jgi:hypothetical protein
VRVRVCSATLRAEHSWMACGRAPHAGRRIGRCCWWRRCRSVHRYCVWEEPRVQLGCARRARARGRRSDCCGCGCCCCCCCCCSRRRTLCAVHLSYEGSRTRSAEGAECARVRTRRGARVRTRRGARVPPGRLLTEKGGRGRRRCATWRRRASLRTCRSLFMTATPAPRSVKPHASGRALCSPTPTRSMRASCPSTRAGRGSWAPSGLWSSTRRTCIGVGRCSGGCRRARGPQGSPMTLLLLLLYVCAGVFGAHVSLVLRRLLRIIRRCAKPPGGVGGVGLCRTAALTVGTVWLCVRQAFPG